MARMRSKVSTRWLAGLLAAVLGLMMADGVSAHEEKKQSTPPQDQQSGDMPMMGGKAGPMMQGQMPMMPGMNRLMMPNMDPARGRKLFASKGCVACHAVNGVGGHDATPLDAHTMDRAMSPFDFAAKMWRMAPAMIYAQEEALGEQILFSGEEIADIIAFVHDDDQQHRFSEALITPRIGKMMNHTHGGGMQHQKEIGHMH